MSGNPHASRTCAGGSAAAPRPYGRNVLAAERSLPGWRRFLAQDALVILLLIATAISLVIWFIERDSPLPYDRYFRYSPQCSDGIRPDRARRASRSSVGSHVGRTGHG